MGAMNALHGKVTECAAGRVKASAWWVSHFQMNRELEWRIPWHLNQRLSPSTLAGITASIAEFQRGESSEAHHYLARSERFSARSGDGDFHAASILFVREENGHAALLLRFMQRMGIPSRKKVFSDGIFRWLRGFSDLGWSSRVLIIAELIAQEYYPCLRAATDHPVLRRICDKIICDEEAHIRFQVERIVRLEAALGSLSVALREVLQTVVMGGAACVVYLGHHPVLKTRMGFASFLAHAFRRNRASIVAMRHLRSGGVLATLTARVSI
jgi:hypothetical protein